MAKIKWDWNKFWQVIKFILTLGISHIENREERKKKEEEENNNTKN